ncbi:DUF1580 domain-containing protein [Paludisphaera soli]|uniref:DUF1580 domain-containing protein n=1 Tax=Paludisphaera soli TaxID=2712865 RepID=UPI0013EB9272|nr:DUF1580 domain-containing protein [Paludisphaera soli]
MTDPQQPLTVAQAARFYPGGTHTGTIIRHITRGVRTPQGVVKLEASRMGGRWTTTIEAIERFRSACTVRSGGEARPSRTSSHAKAEAYLDAIGL